MSPIIAIFMLTTLTVLDASDPECGQKQCRMFCENGFKKNSLGCEICECELQVCSAVQCPLGRICKSFTLDYSGHKIAKCIDPTFPPRCWAAPDSGTCRENLERYYYNTDTDVCAQFEYTGCDGNENRFDTMLDCTVHCIKGLCTEINCAMKCGEAGFKLDKKGCPMCECNELPLLPEPDTGCSPISCMMECPHGKKSDKQGCEICECREAPATKVFEQAEGCPLQMCKMFCELGFVADKDGCLLCQCVEPECPEIECPSRCDYGYERDSQGCQTCTCGQDPCNANCPPMKPVCKAFPEKNGRWEPECHNQEILWCSQVACMMECENGFSNDQFGCHVCECRENPKPKCPMKKCAGNCQYGYKYESDGCRGCDCLPNPCEGHICVLTKVCEASRDKSYSFCTACPAMPKCIDEMGVKRVEIAIDYTHDGLENIDEKDIVPIFQSSVSSMMYIDDEYIRGISLRSVEPSVSKFKFNLVSYGDRNLVEDLKNFKKKILDFLDSTFDFHGAKFTPKPESVNALFSSDPEITEVENEENDPEETDQGNLALIIGCTVGAVVAITVLVAIVVAIIVTRRKHEAVRKDIVYKKVKQVHQPKDLRASPPKAKPIPQKEKPTNPAV